jgi:ATP-binding cassette subfamily B protein
MAEFSGRYDIGSLESTERRISDLNIVKRVLGVYMMRHRTLVVIVGLLLIARTGLTLVGPYIYKVAIDFFIRGNPSASGQWFSDLIRSIASILSGSSQPSVWMLLAVSGLLYIAIGLSLWIIMSLQEYYVEKLGLTIIADIKYDFFIQLENLSQSFFEHGNTGRLVSRATNDADALKQLVSSGIIGVVADCITAIAIVSTMFILDAQLALIALIIAPVLAVVSGLFQRLIRRAWQVARIRIASMTAKVQDFMYGAKVTKAMAQEERAIREFDAVNEENMTAQIRAEIVSNTYEATIGVFSALIQALIWLAGGQQVLGATRTLGDLVAFTQYASSFLTPIESLATFYGQIQGALASAERIFFILDIKPDVTEAPDAVELGAMKGVLEFKDVSFSYVKGQPVLKNISFTASLGERLAIFGPTGSGKSTIINLIGRFYDPVEGVVELDGVDLRRLKLSSLRRNIAIVLQEPYLFQGTIAYNLKFGRQEATDDEMIHVAKLVGMHENIMKLEKGYETELQERGTNLSYGQKQLICLARAVLADPRILILDEATSSVDPYTESVIQDILKEEMRSRIVIVVTHRVSTVRDTDRIIVLIDGEINDEGSHDELIQTNELYRRLCQMQLVTVARSSASTQGTT